MDYHAVLDRLARVPPTDWGMWSLCAGLVMLALRRKRKPAARIVDELDKPLYHWNQDDALTVRKLLGGGIHAFGQTGSGKTSGTKGIAQAILAYGNSSMLVLCGKRNEYKDWLALAESVGRSDDVILIDRDSKWRFNIPGYEACRVGEGAGQVANVVRIIMELRSIIFREDEKGGGEHLEWRKQDERLIGHAVNALMLAGEQITPVNIHNLIASAPREPSQLGDPRWQSMYCSEVMAKAFARPKSGIEAHDFKMTKDYFFGEWPELADKTRSSIKVGTMQTLSVLNTGLCREMFASTTNTTPHEQIEQQKIVIVNYPPAEWGDLGLVANVGLKYAWQRDILRRDIKSDSPIAVIWGDESSLWATAHDAEYLSLCRSYRGCMIYLCQSLNSYKQVMPGDKAEAATEAMLSNFSHKLFFALGDHATAQWAADLVGKELQQFASGSIQHQEGMIQLFQQGSHTSSFNEHYEHVLQPATFMNHLRTGSPVNGYMVDAILVRSGVPFSNGLPYLTVNFDQRN